MTTRSHNLHVSPFGKVSNRILPNSTVATAGKTLINEAVFAAQFAQIDLVDDLLQNELKVFPMKAVDDYS